MQDAAADLFHPVSFVICSTVNELNLYVAEGAPAARGFRRILSSAQHPAYGRFCPAPGHGLGFNELKVIELAEVLNAIQGRPSNRIDFARGLRIEKVIHGFAKSSEVRAWVDIGQPGRSRPLPPPRLSP
jgi:hypothetical protein